jgi:hypothetical protein
MGEAAEKPEGGETEARRRRRLLFADKPARRFLVAPVDA